MAIHLLRKAAPWRLTPKRRGASRLRYWPKASKQTQLSCFMFVFIIVRINTIPSSVLLPVHARYSYSVKTSKNPFPLMPLLEIQICCHHFAIIPRVLQTPTHPVMCRMFVWETTEAFPSLKKQVFWVFPILLHRFFGQDAWAPKDFVRLLSLLLYPALYHRQAPLPLYQCYSFTCGVSIFSLLSRMCWLIASRSWHLSQPVSLAFKMTLSASICLSDYTPIVFFSTS